MIEGVVLAAGSASRFGSDKLWKPLAGRPLLFHALDTALASGLDAVSLVVAPGSARPLPAAAARPLPDGVRILENSAAMHGQMSSLKLAMRESSADALVVFLGDMPLVPAATARALADSFRANGRSAVPLCHGRWRHPRLIVRERFESFLQLPDDQRGTRLLQGAAELELGIPDDYLDVDEPDDLDRVERLLVARSRGKLD